MKFIYSLALAFAATFFFQYAEAEDVVSPEQKISNEAINKALAEKKINDLESLMQNHIASYKKGQITADELSERFSLFNTNNPALEPVLDQWISQYPKSSVALAARGSYFVATAWAQRGTAASKDTNAKQFENLQAYMGRAEKDLRISLLFDDKPIHSMVMLIQVAKGLNKRQEMVETILGAIKTDPKILGARRAYLNAVTPKWGGSFQMMDEIIAEAKSSPMTDNDKRRLEADFYALKADQAKQEKNYDAAHELYKKSYALYPKDVAVLNSTAFVAMMSNRNDEALKALNDSLLLEPQNKWAIFNRAEVYEFRIKDMNKAMKDYLSAADAGDVLAQNRVGLAYFTGAGLSKDEVKAEQYFQKAIALGNEAAKTHLKSLQASKK
jgi:tetratricopeptide (TPR) repeat protein